MVNYMKKIILLILVSFLFLNLENETTKSVFNEEEIEYSLYILKFPNKNISTENFSNYFNSLKVIWIKPYMEYSYKNDMSKYSVYNFDMTSIKSNINKFKNNFIKKLDEKNYKKYALNYKIEGIKIEEMMIYCSNNQIEIINNQIENVDIIKSD